MICCNRSCAYTMSVCYCFLFCFYSCCFVVIVVVVQHIICFLFGLFSRSLRIRHWWTSVHTPTYSSTAGAREKMVWLSFIRELLPFLPSSNLQPSFGREITEPFGRLGICRLKIEPFKKKNLLFFLYSRVGCFYCCCCFFVFVFCFFFPLKFYCCL